MGPIAERDGAGEGQTRRGQAIGMPRWPSFARRGNPARLEMALIAQPDQHRIQRARSDAGDLHQFIAVAPILGPFVERQQGRLRLSGDVGASWHSIDLHM